MFFGYHLILILVLIKSTKTLVIVRGFIPLKTNQTQANDHYCLLFLMYSLCLRLLCSAFAPVVVTAGSRLFISVEKTV